jgi:hypothetical protein
VEQNVFQSLRIANRAYVLETGRVVLTGAGEQLLEGRPRQEGHTWRCDPWNQIENKVRNWIDAETPSAIDAGATIVEAIHLLKEKNIRRLPGGQGRQAGAGW